MTTKTTSSAQPYVMQSAQRALYQVQVVWKKAYETQSPPSIERCNLLVSLKGAK